MSVEIVLSACKDTAVVEELQELIKGTDMKLTVYEKCGSNEYENIKLDNVGREQHTFAHHFNANYNDLAQTTICIPGNWQKHPNRGKFVKMSLDKQEGFRCLTSSSLDHLADFKIKKYDGRKLLDANPDGLKDWSHTHIKSADLSNYNTCYEGVMMVSDVNVKHNPQNVYENIEYELSKGNEPEAGHYMERLMQFAYT